MTRAPIRLPTATAPPETRPSKARVRSLCRLWRDLLPVRCSRLSSFQSDQPDCCSKPQAFRSRRAVFLGLGAVVAVALGLGGPYLVLRREVAGYSRGFEALSWTRLEFANRADGTGPLYALAIWPRAGKDLELLVIMHGYTESAAEYFSEARYWAERGRFVLLPDLRGRRSELAYPLDLVAQSDPLGFHIPGWGRTVDYFGRALAADAFVSAGVPDSGGAELLDIAAAVDAARDRFGALLGSGTDILGYSGGGTSALLAAAKMPYRFDRVVAFFPILDFSEQEAQLSRLGRGPLAEIHAWIGGTPRQVPERYASRSVLGVVENLRQSRSWVFADREDPLCPAGVVEELARRVPPGQFLRVAHSGPGDEFRWHHINPDEHSEMHRFGERVFDEAGRRSGAPCPAVESWVVAGFLWLPDLEIDLGDRQSGVVRVAVERRHGSMILEFEPVSLPAGTVARIRARIGGGWVERGDVHPEGTVVMAPPDP